MANLYDLGVAHKRVHAALKAEDADPAKYLAALKRELDKLREG